MKFACFLLLLLLVSSCCKPNPLQGKEGVWVITNPYSREITTSLFFYISITNEQIENKNITLTNKKLIIQHAEYCTPFLKGKQVFSVNDLNDSMMILVPETPLPHLHYKNPDNSHGQEKFIFKKCKKHVTIKPETVGLLSFSFDSLSSVNYFIDIKGNTAFLQPVKCYPHSKTSIVIQEPCTKRKLSVNEQEVLNQLLEFTHLDTVVDPYYWLGCKFGRYYVDDGFKFNGKNYPMKYHGRYDRNSNYALQGFLMNLSKQGKWKKLNGNYLFSAYIPEERTPQKLAFIPKPD